MDILKGKQVALHLDESFSNFIIVCCIPSHYSARGLQSREKTLDYMRTSCQEK
jgi:hypothetical protein